MSSMCYVVMDGVKLPTPYLTMEDAIAAMRRIRDENGPACYDIIYEDTDTISSGGSRTAKTFSGSSSSSEGGSGCLGLIVIGAIFMAIIGGNNDNIQKTSEMVQGVNEVCDFEQLNKTGIKPCLDAKINLFNRYKQNISEKQAELEQLQINANEFIKTKEERCSKQGLVQYGTEGCKEAIKAWQDNVNGRKECIKEIEQYNKKIEDLARQGVKSSFTHVVSADVLNLRSCARTNCEILEKLNFGEGVSAQKREGDWLKVKTMSDQSGYVASKFLWENKTNSSSVTKQ